MKKQIKTLVAAGLLTAVSAGSMITANADSRVNFCNIKYRPISQLICINGNGKIDMYLPKCIKNPSLSEDKEDVDTTVPDTETAPEVTPDDNTSTETTPEVTPDDNTSTETPDSNDNVDTETTPEVNPDNGQTTPEPETKPEVDNSFVAYQQEVLDLVNQERAKVGAQPLSLNSELSNVATIKSQDMIDKNYFDHNSPTYGSPFDMMKQFGISYMTAGENIAYGQRSPEEVMNSWMNSDGHRKNILNPDFNELGVGIAKASNGQLYWTQMFIGR